MSLGPISSRSGTPRISYSANFQPGVWLSSASSSHANAGGHAAGSRISSHVGQHRFLPVAARNRDDDDLPRRDVGRQDQAAVVAVRHDHAADQPRRHAPRRRPDVLQRLVAALELNLERLREVLPEVVRRARLQRAAVAHQRFDRIGLRRAGKLFALALLALHDRHREHVLAELRVEIENLERLFLRLVGGLVRGVPFLPEELRRAQERPRHLFPAHDVGPLVDEHGQIAPGLNPLLIHHAEDRLRRRTDDQLLLELLGAALGDPGHLRREAFDVLGLAHQQASGNEERESTR